MIFAITSSVWLAAIKLGLSIRYVAEQEGFKQESNFLLAKGKIVASLRYVLDRIYGSSKRRRLILEVDVNESFGLFLAGLSSRAASKDAIAGGVAIETYRGAQGDGLVTTSDNHILAMCSKHPSRFEISRGVNHRVSYIKHPGSLCLVPAGACPVMRAETEFDVVACAFDSAFVNA